MSPAIEELDPEARRLAQWCLSADTAELHFVGTGYNWDFGVEFLTWLAENCELDVATAGHLFALASPFNFIGYASVADAEAAPSLKWSIPSLPLILVLIRRYDEGHYHVGRVATSEDAVPRELWERDLADKGGVAPFRVPVAFMEIHEGVRAGASCLRPERWTDLKELLEPIGTGMGERQRR